ncbi:hypothetical protein ABFS82_10G160300 [Erythranthe guttata]|uniref:probable calcium-binding protein CML50 n=1 Tax=Erythranthe guttata TaxID=4155 RepID=UPI00064DB653|nr:PREDICTED: probable calcium-binding protein CML50 [Erythranthe guttata]|eukprot:XP_012828143.1 PREDICTED: probable calcium-binding protein CML50 [Erythranthe guttata]
MSNYPNQPPSGYPYGAPPTSQSYPSAPYGAPPTSQSYPSAPYGAPQPGAPQYPHQPSPYAPAGSPYSAPQQHGGPPPHQPYGAPPPHQPYGGYPPSAPYGSPFGAPVASDFPPGTDPTVIAQFQAADRDRSGFIDDKELQALLSGYNQSFGMRTVHLLMYNFTNSNVRKIGPKEFTQVYYSLQNWGGIFERFDRDRSNKIDATELRDALLSLGFSVSPMVLDLLVSKFDKNGGKNKAIEYDNFIECCLTVKGLTEKFKEKDTQMTGSANFNYESFMLTVLPFIIA